MRTVGVWALCLLALARAASAQTSADGSIRGTVRDEQGLALPGVTIEAASATTAAAPVAVTESDGTFRLIGVPPGEYTVTATLDGFARYSRQGVLIRAGLNLALDVQLTLAGVQETVQVVADSPLLEVHNPVQSVNISGELQRSLPLGSRREFTDFLEITPGVTARTLDQGNGAQVYMLRGSEIDNHVIQIDGADIGSFRQGLAGLYVSLSTEAIQDTQVKTGGVDAAAPLGVGLIVNMATPSGTNRFAGSVSMTYQGRSWNGNNAAGDGESGYMTVKQADAAIGGPIVRNRVTFFGSFRVADRGVGLPRSAAQLSRLGAIDASFVPFENGGRSHYTFVKATAQLSGNHQVYGFVQQDFNPEVAGFPTDARPFNISAFGGTAVATRWSSIWGSAVIMRVLASYNNKSFNGTTASFDSHRFEGPQQDVFSSSFVSSGRRVGSGLLGQFNNAASLTVAPTSKTTVQADLSYFKRGWFGSHELQTGVLLQPHLANETRATYANSGSALEQRMLAPAGTTTAATIPFMRRVYDSETIVSSSRVAQDYAVYVADAWKPTGRLSVSAGVRVDRILVQDRLYAVQVQDSLEVGPRIGATYVLTADDRNVLRVNWGRIADLPQPTYLPSASGNPVGFTEYYDNDLDGVFETVLRTPPVSPERSNLRVDPDRHQPFVDEWIVGYRRQWPGQVAMDASVVRRHYRNRPAAVEFNRRFDGLAFAGYKDESLNDMYLITNNRWNTQVYSGIELTVSKRTSRINLLGGYTRGFQHLDGTWVPGDPASLVQPAAFANDKGIGSIRGNEVNSLSGTADTRSPSWQAHALRLGAAYQAPWRLSVATTVVVLSGPYSGPIVTRIAEPDPRFGPPIVTLSNGRQVSNPLATTLRFAYADRGDGQIKTPTMTVLNLRVGRDIPVHGHRVNLAVDVFNVTNNAADQQFQNGGNQLYNTTNYAIAPDGSFRGQSRQPPRSAQLLARIEF